MSTRTKMRVKSVVAMLLVSALAFGVTAAPAEAKAKAKSKPNPSIVAIKKIAAANHLPTSDVKALITLAKRESSLNPREITGSCKGLFQLKTKSKQWANPGVNTALAIKYIKHRYGTPRKALAHSYRHGWY